MVIAAVCVAASLADPHGGYGGYGGYGGHRGGYGGGYGGYGGHSGGYGDYGGYGGYRGGYHGWETPRHASQHWHSSKVPTLYCLGICCRRRPAHGTVHTADNQEWHNNTMEGMVTLSNYAQFNN